LTSDFESDVWSAEEIDGDVFSADRKMDEFSGGSKRDVWSVDDEIIKERINLSADSAEESFGQQTRKVLSGRQMSYETRCYQMRK